MSKTNNALEAFKKYYLGETNKEYNENDTLENNLKNSGLSGSSLDYMKKKARAYLTASDSETTLQKNYDFTLAGIERQREIAQQLKEQQEKDIDATAMRQASGAAVNYDRLLRYLPELQKQSGVGNLGVGSSAYTNAYAAYNDALSASAQNASESKENLLQRYLETQEAIEQAKREAQIKYNNEQSNVRNSLSDYLSTTEEQERATRLQEEAEKKATNENVKASAVAQIMSQYMNENGQYTKEGVDRAVQYVRNWLKDENEANDIINQIFSENIASFDDDAKRAYDANYKNKTSNTDFERKSSYTLRFGDEYIGVTTTKNAKKYSEWMGNEEVLKAINESQNGDIVAVVDGDGKTTLYLVDDKDKSDTESRLIELETSDEKNLQALAEKTGNIKYAYINGAEQTDEADPPYTLTHSVRPHVNKDYERKSTYTLTAKDGAEQEIKTSAIAFGYNELDNSLKKAISEGGNGDLILDGNIVYLIDDKTTSKKIEKSRLIQLDKVNEKIREFARKYGIVVERE